MENTKERILQAALYLFAANGYEAVSVSMIASEVGITKGALYKHYQNKRDIFDTILARMRERDAANANGYDMPLEQLEQDPAAYQALSLDSMVKYSKAQFRYWVQDEFASSFRKMLTLEQYRNSEMYQLYQQYLASGPLAYVEDILKSCNVADAQRCAAEFYGTMFLFYSVYDGAENKSRTLFLLDSHLDAIRAKWVIHSRKKEKTK